VNKVLVIGFGNPVRGDDAVGCYAAHVLEQKYRDDPQVEVMAVHQLTPELADDISQSAFVLFVDASVGTPAGTIKQSAVIPSPGRCSHFSRHLNPPLLMRAAEGLYGDFPDATMLSLAGDFFELGGKMSPKVRQSLPELIQLAVKVVESHRHLETSATLAPHNMGLNQPNGMRNP
jgi:hydrogenase maturation protease